MRQTFPTSFFLLFALCLSPFALRSQELTWGSEYEEPASTMATKIVGITADGFYVLRQKVGGNPGSKPRAWVEFFSKDMKLQRSEEMELKHKGKQRDFEDVLMLGGQLYLLTSFNNTAKKRNYLFRQALSPKTLTPSKDLEMIAETEAPNKEREGTFAFALSKDSTKLLVYNELPYERKSPERFAIHVFDQNFEKVWQKNIVLPYPDHQFTVEEYRVDEEGNVFLLCVLYEDEAKWRRRGKPTYQYVVLAYPKSGEEPQELRVSGDDDKFITDLTFRIGKDGALVCAGFYSARGTYSVRGACYFRLDPATRAVSDRSFQPFGFDFLTQNFSEKEKERAKEAEERKDERRAPELYDYSLDELILRSDGGAVLVAEQFYIQQETVRDYPYGGGFYPYGYYPYYRNQYQTNYWYNYNDILVVNIRPTGEIEWSARIPKRQETRNDGGYYSSYAMSTVRDKLFFLFNDNPRNYNPDRKEGRFYDYAGGDGVIVLAEVGIGGAVSVRPFASNTEAGVITRPKMCRQVGRREMAVFGERGRGCKFGSLKFE